MTTRVLSVVIAAMLVADSGKRAPAGTDPVSTAFPPPDYVNLRLVEPLLANLQSGETANIWMRTTHCFGGSIYELHFEGPTPLHVVVLGRPDAVADGELSNLGETTVTKAEAARIDRVLAYYRAGPKDYNCTTQDDIRAHWQTAAGSSNENWHDFSCVVDDSKFSLSLYTVAARARPKP